MGTEKTKLYTIRFMPKVGHLVYVMADDKDGAKAKAFLKLKRELEINNYHVKVEHVKN